MPANRTRGADRDRPRQRDDRPETPKGTPVPPVPTDAERAEQRLQERAREIAASRWVHCACPRGHRFEAHRSSATLPGGAVVCPICHQPAMPEGAEAAARREHAAATSPLALLQRMGEALIDWAQGRLDADQWTRMSEARREEQRRLDPTGGYDHPFGHL